MNHNNYQINKKEFEYDECISKGVCSVSPTLSFLQEFVIEYLKELSFYLLKLKELGIHNEQIKENVIEILSGLITNIDYSDEQYCKVASKLNEDLSQAKELYSSLYMKKNLTLNYFRPLLKFPKRPTFSEAIRLGQKIFNKKNEKLSVEQKTLFEIILNIIKSICINLVELKGLDVQITDAYESILSLFNSLSLYDTNETKLKQVIQKFVDLDYILMEKLQTTREEKYGRIEPVDVSFSTKPNRAILVSGTNLKDLEMILRATQNKDIDVYTHGQMIMAHSYPKLKAYKHLVGHIGEGTGAYLLDFASFPGPVFMTRLSFLKVENFYRNRIFTSDVIAPKGVIRIKDFDYETLINAALSAKGFTKVKEKAPIKINRKEEDIIKKITEVAERIKKGEIKHFFVIGVTNNTKTQKEYFEKFLNLLGDDCFALSFSYDNGKDNVFKVFSEYCFQFVSLVLKTLTKTIPLNDLKPIMLCTRCEQHTISNLLYLKFLGIDKIYFANCSPYLINPALVNSIREMYGIKNYTSNPQADIEAMKSD